MSIGFLILLFLEFSFNFSFSVDAYHCGMKVGCQFVSILHWMCFAS